MIGIALLANLGRIYMSRLQQSNQPGRYIVRARRMARTVKDGAALLEVLGKSASRQAMLKAAEAGELPISAVSNILKAQFSAARLADHAFRQLCGTAIRGFLEEAGFEPVRKNVRTYGDPIFSTGSLYAKRIEAKSDANGTLLFRLLDALTHEELVDVFRYIERKFKS